MLDVSLNQLKTIRFTDCFERPEPIKLSLSCVAKAIAENSYYIGCGELEISQDSDFGGVPHYGSSQENKL